MNLRHMEIDSIIIRELQPEHEWLHINISAANVNLTFKIGACFFA